MDVFELEINEIKKYLRIEYDDEDEIINILKESAIEYLIRAGCKLNTSDKLSFLAISMLVSHWYDNRGVIGDDKLLPMGLRTIILQLKGETIDPLQQN